MRYFIKPEDGEGGRHFYISDICGISGTITHILRNAQKDGKYGPKDIANVADLTTEYDEPSAYIEGGEITVRDNNERLALRLDYTPRHNF